MHYRYRRRDIPEPINWNDKNVFSIDLSLMPNQDTDKYPGVSLAEVQAQVKELADVVEKAFKSVYTKSDFLYDGRFFDAKKVLGVFYAWKPIDTFLAQVLLEIEKEKKGFSIVAKINAEAEKEWQCRGLRLLMNELYQKTVLRRRILLEDKENPKMHYALFGNTNKSPVSYHSYYEDHSAFAKIGFPIKYFKIYD